MKKKDGFFLMVSKNYLRIEGAAIVSKCLAIWFDDVDNKIAIILHLISLFFSLGSLLMLLLTLLLFGLFLIGLRTSRLEYYLHCVISSFFVEFNDGRNIALLHQHLMLLEKFLYKIILNSIERQRGWGKNERDKGRTPNREEENNE